MIKLLIPMTLSTIFAFLSEKNKNVLIDQKKEKLKYFFVFCILIYLSVFTGLRVWYNDTVTYKQMYEIRTPKLSEFFGNENNSFSQGIGFLFVNSFIKTLKFATQDYIMFYGVITMILYVVFIYKCSENFKFSIFLFFTVGCFVFAQAAIKQSLAMALGCWAFYYAAKCKWKKCIFCVIIAALFHPYALIYLLMPLMTFKPWSPKSYFWIVVFLLAGISLPFMFSTIVDITTMMGAEYTVEEFSGEGVNIFRLIVCFAPTLLSLIFSGTLYKNAEEKDYLLMNLTMLNGLIMFVGLFGTANYFARLANFFLPFQVLAIPWLVKTLKFNDKIIVTIFCIIGYLGYMYYENAILRPFDIGFEQISLWTYLKEFF